MILFFIVTESQVVASSRNRGCDVVIVAAKTIIVYCSTQFCKCVLQEKIYLYFLCKYILLCVCAVNVSYKLCVMLNLN